ncbi:hypothetical protein C4D60_Mb04t06770 [Musa balbisiana]|uniref:tryptophan synthase n=1 Tax=Musa balbisiana TaxID=52838 RepID=A0A4S8KA59_MUSBA|nr:hypothetical protein C4D60_Mb04t06770 [Musa balbisiana]
MAAPATSVLGNPNLGLSKPSPSTFFGVRVPPSLERPRRFSSAPRPALAAAVSCTMTNEATAVEAAENRTPGVGLRPDPFGRFGRFGGKYVPETLMYALSELEAAFWAVSKDEDFQKELDGILKDYVGRESPLYFAERLTDHYRRPNGEGPHIYLKREDLNHTGAHKINNAVAQALLAKKLGKKRIIAETGAGQHGVATATVCARFGLECIVYMGAQDMERQALNVFRMRLLGAEVRAVHSGTATLKDATSEAIRDWVTNVETTHYILGLDYPGVGPEHSYLKDLGRAEYNSVTDQEALEAFKRVSRLEGIIPALETSHALAHLEVLCPTLPDRTKVVVCCSGRGDKDVQTAIKHLQL